MADPKPMAHAHTYYLAHRDRCLGELKTDEELCGILRGVWRERAGSAEPGPYDGISTWLDENGAVHVYLLSGGAPQPIADEPLAERIGRRLGTLPSKSSG